MFEATELRSVKKKGTRDPKTIILIVWVPSTKVHAHFVNMFVKHFFLTDKTMGSRKNDRSSGDYGTLPYLLYPQGTRTPPRLRRNEEDTWDSGFCLSSPNSPNIFLKKEAKMEDNNYRVAGIGEQTDF